MEILNSCFNGVKGEQSLFEVGQWKLPIFINGNLCIRTLLLKIINK